MLSRSAFYLYGVLTAIAALMMPSINLDFKPPAENLINDVKILIKDIELVMFFFFNFMSGIRQLPLSSSLSSRFYCIDLFPIQVSFGATFQVTCSGSSKIWAVPNRSWG